MQAAVIHCRIGNRPYMAVTSMDIDYPDDFTLAEAIVAAGLHSKYKVCYCKYRLISALRISESLTNP